MIFDRDGVKVEALHNYHLGDGNPPRSFSYRIMTEGKTVVFTGDVREAADADAFLRDGSDLLFTETGHHQPEAMPVYIKEHHYSVGKLAYLHHGRTILNDPDGSAERIRKVWDGEFVICEDAETITL